MDFDDSVESIADSDLEDGGLQMMLTSGETDAMVMQEREVHKTLKPIERKV